MGAAFGSASLGVCPPHLEWVRGFWAVCLSSASPPFCFFVCADCVLPFFFLGGVCLFLPRTSLSWCTHRSAFGEANRVAVGTCAWLGRALAIWVGWVMYTLGLVAFPVGWPSPSLPGVRWPLADVRQVGVALSHGCGRVSSPSGACSGLLGLDSRLVFLALVLWCALVRGAVSFRALPCCAVLVCAVLRCALLCRAVPRRVVPWSAVRWRGWLRHAVPRRAVLCCGVSCLGVPCLSALQGGAPRCAVLCCFMLLRLSLCGGVWWALFTALPV